MLTRCDIIEIMKKYVSADDLYSYLSESRSFPDDIGCADIESRRSDSDILYRSWDLTFTKDTDASRTDNFGRDEVQIFFNLNQDIEWYVGKDPADPDYQKVNMKKGEVCVFRNNDVPTSMCYKSGVGFKFKSIQMDTSRFADLLKSHFPPEEMDIIEHAVYSRVEKANITPEMYRILSEIDSADRFEGFKRVFLETKMIELTALVLFEILHAEKEPDPKAFAISIADKSAMERLREHVQLKPYLDYDAPMVAEKLSMSISKLNRIFRAMYGTSLHAYVQQMRLEYSAKLLMSGYNVTESATRAGYNNMSYFAKAFKEKYQISPKKYSRRKVSEKEL